MQYRILAAIVTLLATQFASAAQYDCELMVFNSGVHEVARATLYLDADLPTQVKFSSLDLKAWISIDTVSHKPTLSQQSIRLTKRDATAMSNIDPAAASIFSTGQNETYLYAGKDGVSISFGCELK
ncbi:MAG: hypothetical protein EOP04_17970 [Proteobacteria bacterium]|nr:MAG: hypothetical protein EOP04_17970 [Pseudomonadota bacterium]